MALARMLVRPPACQEDLMTHYYKLLPSFEMCLQHKVTSMRLEDDLKAQLGLISPETKKEHTTKDIPTALDAQEAVVVQVAENFEEGEVKPEASTEDTNVKVEAKEEPISLPCVAESPTRNEDAFINEMAEEFPAALPEVNPLNMQAEELERAVNPEPHVETEQPYENIEEQEGLKCAELLTEIVHPEHFPPQTTTPISMQNRPLPALLTSTQPKVEALITTIPEPLSANTIPSLQIQSKPSLQPTPILQIKDTTTPIVGTKDEDMRDEEWNSQPETDKEQGSNSNKAIKVWCIIVLKLQGSSNSC